MFRFWCVEKEKFETYAYDYAGNRSSLNKINYEYYKNLHGGNSFLVKFDGFWYYSYDKNGNRISKSRTENLSDKEYWTYEWDLHNRLVRVRQFNGQDKNSNVDVSYFYDALNHRVERKSGDLYTKYAYFENGNVSFEITNQGKSRSYLQYENNILCWWEKSGEEESKYYTATDIQGSVYKIYNQEGACLWQGDYSAFGISGDAASFTYDFSGLFTGKDIDRETGLVYHWNRWRSEDGSVWLSEDPARDGTNWYGYCGGNPVNFVDLDGLTTRDDYAYQKETSGNWSHNEADAFQKAAAEANQGYSYGYSGPTTQDIEIRLLLQIRKIEESVSGSYEFLKTYYDLYNSSEGKIKGLAAKNLREIIRRKTRFNLDGLFKRDESFMNNELRDFLNLNERGTMEYDLTELLLLSRKKGSGWRELSSMTSMYHQTNTSLYLNAKFVHEDGREVIIDRWGNVKTKYDINGNFNIDFGTFNYADPSEVQSHKKYDVNPFEGQYRGQYTLRYYVNGFGGIIPSLRPNSYYWDKNFVFVNGF